MTGSRRRAPVDGGAGRDGRGDEQGSAPAPEGRGKARRVLLLGLSLALLATAGGGWLYLKLGGNLGTFGQEGVSDNRPPDTSAGQNILLLGSDSRTGGNAALGGGDKDAVGRSDTALLLHVYADAQHAVAVSIPRDTLVPIPSCRLPDGSWTEPRERAMFNTAYTVGETAEGNPACTQNTVEQLTGLRVDHTLVIDFKGFSDLTEVVGGVRVCVPKDIYERDLDPKRATRGKRVFARGEQDVSGQRALDYVRIRHGIGDGSDLGRIKRQQAFVGSLMKKIKEDGLTPGKLLPLADAATKSMTVDPGLGSADKLLGFAMGLKDIDLDNTKFLTIPWRYEGNRVAVVEPDAAALWQALRSDRTLDGKNAGGRRDARPAADTSSATTGSVDGTGTTVTVHNGTATGGLAARAATRLTEHGFTVSAYGNAPRQDLAGTVITHGPGEEDGARTAARLFPGARLVEGAGPGIDVTVGTSYAADPDAGPQAAPSPQPTGVPAEVADGARSADDDLCDDLSYG
ncbi:LCP family protein [Streptomyces sp. BBFR102]|uniref:LCP family protein n=1 Tax=Streptomyces sp. BBFR102 TaxID=3448171 RepID=UPI003F52FDE0